MDRTKRTKASMAKEELDKKIQAELAFRTATSHTNPVQFNRTGPGPQDPAAQALKPPKLKAGSSPAHLRTWLTMFTAYREAAMLNSCPKNVAFGYAMTLLDDVLINDIHSDKQGKEETYGLNDIIAALQKSFLLSHPMSARRIAIAKHKRRPNEVMTDYLVRLCQDRTTADSDASTPGELLLMDLIKGADHPKMVAQLHKIAVPTAESIKNCVIEFVSREQAAKGDGATDEVVFLAQVSPTARSGSFNRRDDHTDARNNSQSRSNARSRSRSISTSNRNMRCYRCNSSSHI